MLLVRSGSVPREPRCHGDLHCVLCDSPWWENRLGARSVDDSWNSEKTRQVQQSTKNCQVARECQVDGVEKLVRFSGRRGFCPIENQRFVSSVEVPFRLALRQLQVEQ